MPMPQVGPRAAVFMDRDGVLIHARPDYVRSWADVELLPGALEALGRLHARGYRIAVVTNQSCVGRGLVSRQTVDDINEKLGLLAAAHGARIEAFEVCPHLPEEGCDCRKPKPGLLTAAARRLGVPLAESFMIGDQAADVAAAVAAGCRPVLVLSGETTVPPHDAPGNLLVCRDLRGAVDAIMETVA